MKLQQEAGGERDRQRKTKKTRRRDGALVMICHKFRKKKISVISFGLFLVCDSLVKGVSVQIKPAPSFIFIINQGEEKS